MFSRENLVILFHTYFFVYFVASMSSRIFTGRATAGIAFTQQAISRNFFAPSYILSCTVSKLLVKFALLDGVPLFSVLVYGEPLYTGP